MLQAPSYRSNAHLGSHGSTSDLATLHIFGHTQDNKEQD
jgi:hypothetical protein